MRKWCGFATQREPDRYYIAGLLFEEMPAPSDTSIGAYNPALGQVGYLFPQGDGRVRAYDVYPIDADFRLQGESSIDRDSLRRRCAAEFRPNTMRAREQAVRSLLSSAPIIGLRIPIAMAWC